MLLLDTCAAIWLSTAVPLSRPSMVAIRSATSRGDVLVSPISAWEISLLAAKVGYVFSPSPREWFTAFLERPGVRLAPLTPEIAIDSSFLPGRFHDDPADRILVSTARHLNAQLVTRDRRMLSYARSGHVRALRC